MSDHYLSILTAWAMRCPMPMAGCHKSRGKYIITGGDSIMYDRNYDRDVDNTKILNVTGLKLEDFTSFK